MATDPAPDPVTAEVGRRIRSHRQERSLTLEQLGERAGMHATYVGRLERGERSVLVQNLVRIAEALGVDPAELVRGLRSGGG